MSAPPGWYPDPAGKPDRYRFWDGQAWGTATADRPDQPLPGAPVTPAAGRGHGAPTPPGGQSAGQPSRRPVGWRLAGGWWLAGSALIVAVVVVMALVIRSIGGGIPDQSSVPDVTDPSQRTCPRPASSTPGAASTGDRVRSGLLSYPRLPPPFGPPMPDARTPFGYDVQTQQAEVERSPDGETIWVAWALIARLLAGDGFYGPRQGAEVMADCAVALFYDNHEIERTDTRREAITVDGHPAYLIESHLAFDIPGIQTKGETMIVVVVDVGQGEAGLFYGTIPDTSPRFMAPVRGALAGLEVG